ncbi:MAG: M3 family metallopeptidase [Butyricicoccus sp.]|nr:M3 family metallopeptidase [Butyricicoccus sp.]
MKKRLTGLFLCAAMLLSLCACAATQPRGSVNPGQGSASSPELPQGTIAPAAGDKVYFEEVWHQDVKYSARDYEHYEREWLDEYLEPIYALAANGGTAEDFSSADLDLTGELYYIHTMLTYILLQNSADPDNESIADEVLYMQELYYTAVDEYWNAMHAMAVSPYAELMDGSYHPDFISDFREYEPVEDGSELEAYSAENALINEYYRLMAQDEIDCDAVGEVFIDLVELRRASVDGSYAEYAYESFYGRDYTPEEVRAVWQGAKEYIVPVMCRCADGIYDGVDFLMSSNAVDYSSAAIINNMDKILPRVSGELYTAFRYMVDYRLCDISHDPRKANTGYTTMLYCINEPYIFNAAYDEFYDYTDMFHEFGHFVNYFYTESDLLFGLSDNDLSELQSQGMELMFTHYYDEIFGEYADAALGYLLLNMIYSIVDGALYDEFQQRVYAEEDLTVERVNEIYAGLYEEYGYEPYDGCETEWMGVSHNFETPFYYISYAVSAVGALELYRLMDEDWEQGLDRFLTVLAMDTEIYYYSGALEDAGLSDIFDLSTYSAIAGQLEESLS